MGFVGKNSIVWNDTTPLQIFKVASVDGMTARTDRELHVEGRCHFTLDATDDVDSSCQPICHTYNTCGLQAQLYYDGCDAARKPCLSGGAQCDWLDDAQQGTICSQVVECSKVTLKAVCDLISTGCKWGPPPTPTPAPTPAPTVAMPCSLNEDCGNNCCNNVWRR